MECLSLLLTSCSVNLFYSCKWQTG